MSIRIDFAYDVNHKVESLVKLIAKLTANGKLEETFTAVDLRNEGRKNYWGNVNYGFLATGGHLTALVNRGILTVVGKETYQIEVEEREWFNGREKTFTDLDGNVVAEHNLIDGVAYTVKTFERGHQTIKRVYTNKRNIYKLNGVTVEEIKQVMLDKVATEIDQEYKRVR